MGSDFTKKKPQKTNLQKNQQSETDAGCRTAHFGTAGGYCVKCHCFFFFHTLREYYTNLFLHSCLHPYFLILWLYIYTVYTRVYIYTALQTCVVFFFFS